MPFTLSHAAAVFPLYRRLSHRVPLAALVIGSTIPDLPLFFEIGVRRAATHSLTGFALFTLPVGGALYLAWRTFMAAPFHDLLPDAVACRLSREPAERSPSLWWGTVLGLLAGAATHVVWDAFTHEQGFIAKHIPPLQALVFEIGGYPFWGYKIAQHVSSVLGALLLTFWLYRWFERTPRRAAGLHPRLAPRLRTGVLLLLAAIPLVAAISGGVFFSAEQGWLASLHAAVAALVFQGARWLAAALFVYCACWQAWRTWHPS